MSEPRTFLGGRVTLLAGDCISVMHDMPDNSIDSIVTDPPYGLQFMGREWDKLWRNETEADRAYVEKTSGTLTSRARKLPDYSSSNQKQMQEWHEAWAREAIRVLKPGGYIMAFSGCRTYHRMACAIEDAGFITHPFFAWAFGSGFPKAHSVSKQIDKAAGQIGDVIARQKATGNARGKGAAGHYANALTGVVGYEVVKDGWDITAPATDAAREWDGWFYGTQSLKPAIEPIYFGQKPFSEKTGAANVLRWGTGAINVGACRVAAKNKALFPAGVISETESVFGSGSGLYSNHPRRSDSDPTARWPANLIHDGSEEVLACFPETASVAGNRGEQSDIRGNNYGRSNGKKLDGSDSVRGHTDFGSSARFFASFPQDDVQYNVGAIGLKKRSKTHEHGVGDSGSQARYFAAFPQDAKRIFYTSKAGADDRLGSRHPTVKPLDLIQYLVRLITPKNGVCLDLFAGTGTTGEACFREGFRCILIDREAEYVKDIERRMSLVMEGPDTRAYASAKARNGPRDDGPLFGHEEKIREPNLKPSASTKRSYADDHRDIGAIGLNNKPEAAE